MRAIIVLMLAVQAAILLVTAFTVLTVRSPTGVRGRPYWSSLIVVLAMIGAISWQIGEKHAGQPGADILMWGSPFLLGMAIMAALIVLRRRRGLDG